MTKVYISGKITGEDLFKCQKKFEDAEKKLLNKGYEPVNPMRLVPEPVESWESAMRICLAHLMACDAILFLPDWVHSRGATLEGEVAMALGFQEIKL